MNDQFTINENEYRAIGNININININGLRLRGISGLLRKIQRQHQKETELRNKKLLDEFLGSKLKEDNKHTRRMLIRFLTAYNEQKEKKVPLTGKDTKKLQNVYLVFCHCLLFVFFGN